jgi:hypothetical protein
MKAAVFALISILTMAISAGAREISTLPASHLVSEPGHLVETSAGLTALDDGSYGLIVRLKYQIARPNDPKQSKAVYFRLSEGSLLRQDNDLFLLTSTAGPVRVAHTEWWYSNWAMIDGFHVKQSVRRVHNGSGFENYQVSAVLSGN